MKIKFFSVRFRAEQTIVRERLRPTSDGVFDNDLPFIDIIICPSYEVAYNDSKLQKYGLTKRNYRSEGKFHSTYPVYKNMDLQGIFNDITHDVADILSEVRFNTLNIDQDTFVEKFAPSSNDTTNHIKVVTKYFDSFGKCFSIRPQDHVLKYGINIIDIVARMDVTIHLGYPGQFMYNTKTRVGFF